MKMGCHDRTGFGKNIIKRLRSTLDHTGAYKLAEPFYAGIGHILLFHRVCPRDGIGERPGYAGLEVAPEYLENILAFFIGQGCEFISLDRLVCILQAGKSDKRFVVITFDDGYADNFTYAYPILKKYNIPFTVYITTNFIDRKAVLWWYLLQELVRGRDRLSFRIGGEQFDFKCLTANEKRSTIVKIHSILFDSDEKILAEKIKNIFGSSYEDIYKKTDELMLTWAQVKELSRDGLVTIGAHTVNHYALNRLSELAARYEILESKKRIESHIEKEVRHFSYPFGGRTAVGEREFMITKECGFETAATNRMANVFFAHRDYSERLPRIEMSEDVDAQRLRFLMSGFVHCVHNRFKRLITV